MYIFEGSFVRLMAEDELPPIEDVEIPIQVLKDGQARPRVAAYLRNRGYEISQIAEGLGLAEQTVRQYVTDVKKGRR